MTAPMEDNKISTDALAAPEIIPLGGFPLLRITANNLVQQLQLALQTGKKQILFFANTNFIVQCQPLKERMAKANAMIVNDGIGVTIAAWLVHRRSFSENLPGTDFIPHYLQQARESARVFLLGGKPGVARRAAQKLQHEYGVNVVDCRDGYDEARDAQQLVSAINASQATVLLVAMGNPAQERWILDHDDALNVPIMMGVGALLDFWAGDKPRAPGLARKLHLEWLYRLCLEPARLMRRYTLDIVVFLALCLRSGKEFSSEAN